jgi:ligand-binding sensor domain-containing protein
MVGTRNGLFTVEYGGVRASRAKAFPENSRVTFLRMDNRGWLWAGASDGVYVTDDKGANFRRIAASDGLPSDAARAAVLAGSNAVVVATDAGLSKLTISR